jgi:predicted DNA-binding transcriptional regulator YafY
MGYIDYIERIKKMDDLIRNEQTGNADELAVKMEVSRATVFNYIEVLKSMGAQIEFNKKSKTFFYLDKNFEIKL